MKRAPESGIVELDLEEVNRVAQRYAGSMVRKYGVPTNKFSADDVVGEFMLKFIEKGYYKKYDTRKSKGSFENYIFTCIRNMTIKMLRQCREEESLDEIEEVSGFVPNYKTDPLQNLVMNEIFERASHIRFGTNRFGEKVVLCNGHLYSSTVKSILQLLYNGYSKPEIANLFGVSVPTIYRAVKKAQQFFTEDGDRR